MVIKTPHRLQLLHAARQGLALDVANRTQYERHKRQRKRKHERPAMNELYRKDDEHTKPNQKECPTLP